MLAVLLGIVFSEFSGYIIHRLLHLGRLGHLSRLHLDHHLVDFPPGSRMRALTYASGARDRTNLLGLGIEWLIPSAVCICLLVALGIALGLSLLSVCISVGSAIAWSTLGIGYMHDAMHTEGFWMLNIPIVGRWFRGVRKLHDIHHNSLDPSGLTDVNFGICSFVLDRVCRTFGTSLRR